MNPLSHYLSRAAVIAHLLMGMFLLLALAII